MVSENGSLTDVALNGVTRFVVPPDDVYHLSSAILKMLNESATRQRMATNTRERIEELLEVRNKYKKDGNADCTNTLRKIGFDRKTLTVVHQTQIS